jgi:hypothetical protein
LLEPKTALSPDAKSVEIIFVHGLGGSSKGTWTHPRTKGFWPTWLHDEQGFEHVRISTFGYDANFGILAAGNQLGIPDFATQLLDDIDLHYYRRKEEVVR